MTLPKRPDPSDTQYAGYSLLAMAYLDRDHKHAVAKRAVEALRAVFNGSAVEYDGLHYSEIAALADAALREIEESKWTP